MNKHKKIIALIALLFSCTFCFADLTDAQKGCGMTDYSLGSDALVESSVFISNMMVSVVFLLYAIAGIVVVISALEIYIKMNLHEGDITKNIMYLVGGAIFMMIGMQALPAFFGYDVNIHVLAPVP